MTQTYSLLKSRTFWTLVIMALLPVFSAVVATLPQSVQAIAEVLLGLLGAYFHKDGMVQAGATN
jgi:uncharacterized membrane protein